MLRFLLMRLLWAAPIVLAIAVLGFLLLHLVRGDPVTALIGDFPAPPEYVARVRAVLELENRALKENRPERYEVRMYTE